MKKQKKYMSKKLQGVILGVALLFIVVSIILFVIAGNVFSSGNNSKLFVYKDFQQHFNELVRVEGLERDIPINLKERSDLTYNFTLNDQYLLQVSLAKIEDRSDVIVSSSIWTFNKNLDQQLLNKYVKILFLVNDSSMKDEEIDSILSILNDDTKAIQHDNGNSVNQYEFRGMNYTKTHNESEIVYYVDRRVPLK